MNDLSIIIPIYNTSCDLLQRCLASIKQNVQDLKHSVEVLMVDDGSTESYIEKVLKDYEKEDFRFRYIYKRNGGVSDARNVGIAQSKYEYITFVDADDYLAPGALQYMMDVTQKTQAEILIFGFYKDEESCAHSHFSQMLSHKEIVKLQYCIISHIYDRYYLGLDLFVYGCWGRLFKKSILQKYHLQFNTNIAYSEDAFFNFCYISFVSKVYIDNKPVYHYVTNQESASMHFSFRKGLNLPVLLNSWENFILLHYPEDRKMLELLSNRALEEIRGVRYQYFTHPENKKSFWELKSEMKKFLSTPPIDKWVKGLRLVNSRDVIALKNIVLLKLHLYWLYLIIERNKRKQ